LRGTSLPTIFQDTMTPRVRITIEQVVRMRIAGIRDGVIAVKLGMTQSGLSRILALPEYQDLENAVLTGHVSKMDEMLAGKIKDMEAYFEKAVPVALRTLLETCTQRRDLRAAMSASQEILDRDPQRTFSKKTSISMSQDAPAVSEKLLESVAVASDKAATESSTPTIV
jgi:hypothetical protein